MKKSATIYLVHHALTPGDGTPNEVLNGWGHRGISPKGQDQLSSTIDYLSDKNIGEVYSSDLPRSAQTGEIIRKGLNIAHPLTERRGLRPMDAGVLAGQKKVDVQEALDDLKSRRWAKAPGGESYGRFLGRFGQELHRTIQEALGEDYNCAYVMSSHNFGAIPHLLSGGKKPAAFSDTTKEGGVSILDVHDGGGKITYRPDVFRPGGTKA